MTLYVPLKGPEADHRYKLATAINQLIIGKVNTVGTVTLTANATTTTLTNSHIGADSFIQLMPITANAAAAITTTYISARVTGSATITHANNAQADKDFVYVILG